MEDEKGEEAAAAASCAAAAPIEDLQKRCESATGWSGLSSAGLIADLVSEGHDFESRILPLLRDEAEARRKINRGPPNSWAYFAPMIRDASRQPKPASKPAAQEFVPVGSPEWGLICRGGKESLWRGQLKKQGSVEGVFVSPDRIQAARALQ